MNMLFMATSCVILGLCFGFEKSLGIIAAIWYWRSFNKYMEEN